MTKHVIKKMIHMQKDIFKQIVMKIQTSGHLYLFRCGFWMHTQNLLKNKHPTVITSRNLLWCQLACHLSHSYKGKYELESSLDC